MNAMWKVMMTAMVAAALLPAAPVWARGRRCCCTPNAPVYAPAAEGSATAAQSSGGYRTYSYEGGAMTGSAMRVRSSSAREPYLDATSKALGRFGH